MKNSSLVCGLWLVLFAPALHAQFDLFSNPAAKTNPTGSARESYLDGVRVFTDVGDPTDPFDNFVTANPIGTYSFSATLSVPLDGFDLATLTEDAPFRLAIGDFEVSGTLDAADAGSFARKSVTFHFNTDENPDTGRITVLGRCTVAWTASRLTITVTESVAGELGAGHALILCGDLDGPGVGTVPLELEFGDGIGSRLVHWTGTGRTTDKRIGPVDEPIFEGPIYQGSATGALDFKPPVVTVLSPLNRAVVARKEPVVVVKTDEPENLGPSSVTVNGGEPVELLSDPGTGHLVAQVTLDQPDNTLVFEVQDSEGNAARPVTVTALYRPLAASWVGTVVGPSAALSGTITVTSNKDGVFTGKLLLGGGAQTIRGTFDASGEAAVNLVVARVPWRLELSLDLEEETFPLTGQLLVGTETAAIAAGRSTWNAQQLFASRDLKLVSYAGDESGDPPVAGEPYGFTWATGTLSKAGAVKLTGKLADGSPFSAAGQVDDATAVALFFTVTPKSTFALCKGTVEVLEDPLSEATATFTGELDWRRPAGGTGPYQAGFTVLLPTFGASFAPGYRIVIRDPDPTLPPFIDEDTPFGSVGEFPFAASGGGIADFTHNVTLSGPARVVPELPNPQRLSMTVSNTTGAVTGSFLVGTTALSYSGVAVPLLGLRGFALAPGGSVRVQFEVTAP